MFLTVIYLSLVMGVLVKFHQYGVEGSGLLWAPVLPLTILVFLPAASIFSFSTADQPVTLKLISLFVVPFIAVKYFPMMIGVAADCIAHSDRGNRGSVLEVTWPSYRQFCFESTGSVGQKLRIM